MVDLIKFEELKGNVSHQNQQISDTTDGGMYANIDEQI